MDSGHRLLSGSQQVGQRSSWVVVSLNTVAFFLAFSLMVFAYGLWSWSFFPSSAIFYTVAALRGFFGQNVRIKHSIGKRFRVFLESGRHIDIRCKIKEASSGDWFVDGSLLNHRLVFHSGSAMIRCCWQIIHPYEIQF